MIQNLNYIIDFIENSPDYLENSYDIYSYIKDIEPYIDIKVSYLYRLEYPNEFERLELEKYALFILNKHKKTVQLCIKDKKKIQEFFNE